MGTNFYFLTKNKELAETITHGRYEITDTPDWGYEIHIAKTSYGWLPLFQSYAYDVKDTNVISSVRRLKEIYNTDEVAIYDEYGTKYNWYEFDKRVLQFNGGTKENREIEQIQYDEDSPLVDKYMPNFVPVSHFEYADGKYTDSMYRDSDGYEFDTSCFS